MKKSAGWGKENQRVCYEKICRWGKEINVFAMKKLPWGRKINVFAMKISAGWGRGLKM